jgi:6-pyruvoyltetrahydropterin/6-carboxytetrahydropterin synthase
MRKPGESLQVLHAASSRFEAARRVDLLAPGHRCRNLHGHGFVVSAFSSVPVSSVSYSGDEVVALQQALERCSGLLDYGLLNDRIAEPTDENVARWIRDRMDVPGTERVAVQSTPDQGVAVDVHDGVSVWRRYRFQAAHRLPFVPSGHKCGRMHGHGFEVIIRANSKLMTSDPSVDYECLDDLWAPIAAEVGYNCLNDVPGLSNPTSEMISSWIWGRLKPKLPTLSWVTVYETASCGAMYNGSSYRIWKDFTVDSAVRHRNAPIADPRHRVHGHTYTLRLHLSAPLDKILGWTVDFGDVKAVFDPIFKSLDHHPLHEHAELGDCDTTTIARWLFGRTRVDLPQLVCVDLFETEGCGSLVGEDLACPSLPV